MLFSYSSRLLERERERERLPLKRKERRKIKPMTKLTFTKLLEMFCPSYIVLRLLKQNNKKKDYKSVAHDGSLRTVLRTHGVCRLTCSYLEARKTVIGKQGSPRSDAT